MLRAGRRVFTAKRGVGSTAAAKRVGCVMARPEVVALDVIETLFSSEPLVRRLVSLGLPEAVCDRFLAEVLRDAFALEVTGVFRPFPALARGALEAALSSHGLSRSKAEVEQALAAFGELTPHPDVAQGLELAQSKGLRLIALTNGSIENTRRLFDKAGLSNRIERVVSIEEVRHWKPHVEVYRHAAAVVGLPADRLALVAAHGWDVHGAARAGMSTGWIERNRKPRNEAFRSPTVSGATLAEVFEKLADLD